MTDHARTRRTHGERTEATRAQLLAAARELFTAAGYAGTSTPAIVSAAGVTRGALYHHFSGKQDLFRAVVEVEAAAVAGAIESSAAEAAEESPAADEQERALLVGGRAYLRAMAVAGRTRLLLVDAPAVLGAEAAEAVDRRHAQRTLRECLAAVVGDSEAARSDELAELMSAAFDAAATAVAEGGDPDRYQQALDLLVRSLVAGLRQL